jgi:hypothetical protein
MHWKTQYGDRILMAKVLGKQPLEIQMWHDSTEIVPSGRN